MRQSRPVAVSLSGKKFIILSNPEGEDSLLDVFPAMPTTNHFTLYTLRYNSFLFCNTWMHSNTFEYVITFQSYISHSAFYSYCTLGLYVLLKPIYCEQVWVDLLITI